MNGINLHVIDFRDTKVKETVTQNEDGTYSIFLNARFTQEQQTNAYIHALKHILRIDFESKEDVNVIEYYAHNL